MPPHRVWLTRRGRRSTVSVGVCRKLTRVVAYGAIVEGRGGGLVHVQLGVDVTVRLLRDATEKRLVGGTVATGRSWGPRGVCDDRLV